MNIYHIHLGWNRHTRGSMTLSKIFVNTCHITKNTRAKINNQLIISCKGDAWVSGSLGEDNYIYD